VKHYLILDKDNMPVGEEYKGIGPIDIAQEHGNDINTYGLWLYDTVMDKFLDYRPEEHRVFEAKIGSCTLNGGNGRWCDRVRFIREVPKEECLAMEPYAYIELPEGVTWENVVIREVPGIAVFNPKGVTKLTLD
jgi:hypothetical protein